MNIRFYFDPSCPWCWVTSRWLEDVSRERKLNIEWMPFSLAIKNEEDLESDDRHVPAHQLLRLAAKIKQDNSDKIGEYYKQIGKLIHLDENHNPQSVAELALKTLELESDLTRVLDDVAFDTHITESMKTALDVVGEDVGTPIILFETDEGTWQGFFGPVITKLPDTDSGLKLWDGLSELATNTDFYELKRTRNENVQPETTQRMFD